MVCMPHLVEHVVRLEQAEEDLHVREALLRARVRGERRVGCEQAEQLRAACAGGSAVQGTRSRARHTFVLDVLADPVCDLGRKALFVRHLLPNLKPWGLGVRSDGGIREADGACLVELVDSGGDGADLVGWHAADLEDAVEDLAVVELPAVSQARSLKLIGVAIP
jgi:hypothetical protein